MRLTCSFRMPLRFARHSAGGMALTIVAIGCGVALVCAIDLANRAVLRAFVEIVDTMAGRAALEVAAGEGGLFPEDVAARVGSVPGVELALPVVKAMAFTLDRGSAVAQERELAHRAQAAAPLAGAGHVLAQLVAQDAQGHVLANVLEQK